MSRAKLPPVPRGLEFSALRQQHIEIGGGSLTQVVAVNIQKFTRGSPPPVAQQSDEIPLCILARIRQPSAVLKFSSPSECAPKQPA